MVHQFWSDKPQSARLGEVGGPPARLETRFANSQTRLAMNDFPVRSPAVKVGGIVYFGRMLDKIRAHAEGKLPAEYQANLGKGFDETCTTFLQVDYQQLTERVKQGGSDEEILQWCCETGRQPSPDQIDVWNEFMRKRGWNDEITEFLIRRKMEAGMAERSEIRTMFEFIDVDEGRPLPDALGDDRTGTAR
jgi:uncharacterized protein DUF5069